ncbi:MAG TPA: metallophosphoesterase family protein [Bryobacteraceae bacterium]|nr:metallophosphoesterase family protein [Bryobacteraceae bacterium]
MQIGLISDTHGLLRPEALRELAGVGRIIHAGDVGKPEILAELAAIAPVTAVRGNIDQDPWAARLPVTAKVEVNGVRIYIIHDVHDLKIDPAAAGFAMVVSGHSHKASREERSGVLYLNPGSAGPRRFRLPITLARVNLAPSPWTVEFVHLE